MTEPGFGHLGAALSQARTEVTFNDCSEIASIAPVEPAAIGARVPVAYTVAGGGAVALLVLRVANCDDVWVDGRSTGAAIVSQVGINLSSADGGPGPDPSADLNNYALYFSTNNAGLAAGLRRLGVTAKLDPRLEFEAVWGQGESQLVVRAFKPNGAPYTATAGVNAPDVTSTSFVATWWEDGPKGRVKMRSTFPNIHFGVANTNLQTHAGSELATLLGATETTFPIFDSYNEFASAELLAARE